MLNSETGNGLAETELAEEGRHPAGLFALVTDFYTAASTQQNRWVLRDMLSQIITGLDDQFKMERSLFRMRGSALQAHERMSNKVLAELQDFLDRSESEDEPVTRLAHALDGLLVRQLRGELRLLS